MTGETEEIYINTKTEAVGESGETAGCCCPAVIFSVANILWKHFIYVASTLCLPLSDYV